VRVREKAWIESQKQTTGQRGALILEHARSEIVRDVHRRGADDDAKQSGEQQLLTEDEIDGREGKRVHRCLPRMEHLLRKERIGVLPESESAGHVHRDLLIGDFVTGQRSIHACEDHEQKAQEQREPE